MKLASGKTAEKALRKLAWNVDDLSHLNDDGWKYALSYISYMVLLKAPKPVFCPSMCHGDSQC